MGQKLLSLLLGTLLSLGMLEVGIRLSGLREEQVRVSTVFDPLYGTVRRDSWMVGFQPTPGAGEASLRGQRVVMPKPASEQRVLFLGDSGTEGVLIGLEETYPKVFARRMARPGLSAINAGVYGMTTLDELHFLRERLRPLDPDVVVLGLFMSNDINFNLAHVERRRSLASRSPALRAMLDHSALLHFASLSLLSLGTRFGWFGQDGWLALRWQPREMALLDRNGLHMLSYPLGELATYVRTPSPLIDRAFEVLLSALARFDALARADGFRFVVLLIPSPSAVAGQLRLLHYPDIYERLSAAGIDLSETDLDVGLPTRRVLAICEDLSLLCIDPTPRFQAMGDGVFFPDDEHPTALGHAVLAEALVAESARFL